MARGDVIFVDVPSLTRGSEGREQIGRRPAVVVQADHTSEQSPTIMIVPMTRNLNALRFPHTIQINPSNANGLNFPSVLLVFQLRAIDKDRIINTIGRIDSHYLEQLDNEMRDLLNIT